MPGIPEWWRDLSFAKTVSEAQGTFDEFRRRMEAKILRFQDRTDQGTLIGYVRHLSVQGSEGPVWTISFSEFRFMPLPLNPLGRFEAIFCPQLRVPKRFIVGDLNSQAFKSIVTSCALIDRSNELD